MERHGVYPAEKTRLSLSRNNIVNPDWWRPVAEPVASDDNPGELVEADTGNVVPFMALLTFLLILLLAPQQIFPVLAPLRIALIAIVIATLAHVYGALSRGVPVIRLDSITVLALAIVGWAVLTVPFSIWPGGSISFMVGKFFKTLIVFLLLANVVDTLPKLRGIAWMLVSAAVILSLTTIKNFASDTLMQGTTRVLGYDAPLSQNPNDMALMLNLILPFAVALLLMSKRFIVKVLLGVVICLFVAAIVATFSRAGFLTLAVTFSLYLWYLRSGWQRLLMPLLLIFALGAIPFLPSSYFERLGTIANIEGDASGSAQERWRDTVAATRLVIKQPVLGSGIGMNQLAMNDQRGANWTEIHNVYLTYAVELGLPGLVLFLALYFGCLKSVRARSPGKMPANDLDFLQQGIKVSLIAFGVAALFHPVAFHFYFYLVAGLAIAARAIRDRHRSGGSMYEAGRNIGRSHAAS